MRLILYIFFSVGGVLSALALSMVFLNNNEDIEIAPQTPSIDVVNKIKPDTKNMEEDTLVNQRVSKLKDEKSSTLIVQPNADIGLKIDIARVKPDGAAVVAGSAPAGSVISVFEDKVLLGKTEADANGEWVVVLEKLLGSGQHLISVAAELDNDTTIIAETSIAVEIYEDYVTKPLVALLPESKTDMPILLQSPDDEPKKFTKQKVVNTKLAIVGPRSLSWQNHGMISISGHSRNGVKVAVSANGIYFGEALVLADGTWQVTAPITQGRKKHRFEFVLIDSVGQAVATYFLPVFSRDLQKGLDGSQLVVVNKGDALWRIAYRSYGEGVRYVDIVRKNTTDIENPDLIYPNQIFALPKSTLTN